MYMCIHVHTHTYKGKSPYVYRSVPRPDRSGSLMSPRSVCRKAFLVSRAYVAVPDATAG